MIKFNQYPYPVKFIKFYLEKECYNLCKEFIDKYNTMLALSFGKDSMTILHILSKYNLLDKVKLVMFNNSGYDSTETLMLKKYVIEKYKINNFEETVIDNSERFIPKDLQNYHHKNYLKEFVYNVLEKPRWEIMDKYKINGTILGLRKEESKVRRINYYKKGIEYYNKRELSNILQPIVKWSTLDIFSYLYSENIPIHPVYNRSKKMGFDFRFTRVNLLIDFTGSNDSWKEKLKILFPKDMERIFNKIPELRRLL